MKPVDYRNETWESLQTRVHGLRLAALNAWRQHGPGTTRAVAARSGIDILTFRPRTTELFQLGLLALVNADERGSEGRYRALTPAEAMWLFQQRRDAARSAVIQRELALA